MVAGLLNPQPQVQVGADLQPPVPPHDLGLPAAALEQAARQRGAGGEAAAGLPGGGLAAPLEPPLT
eukprot:858975-Alexandrium_andersonii.AAC.1